MFLYKGVLKTWFLLKIELFYMWCIEWVLLKILRKTIRCVKSVLIRSFFWSVFSCIRTEYGDILRIWRLFTQWFCKIPLVANSEPQVILFFSWNLAYLSLDAVVLQFLKNSSSVFFKGFQIVSNLSFLQFRISCFLETPLSGCFRPATIVFS